MGRFRRLLRRRGTLRAVLKRCNWQGALAGMLSGGLMVFVWKYLISPLGGVFGIYELLPAFLTSLAVCVVVSLVTPAPTEDILAEFDAAK